MTPEELQKMMYNPDDPLNPGPHEVLLSSGETRVIDIELVWRTSTGEPAFIKDTDGLFWNWRNFMAVRVLEDT